MQWENEKGRESGVGVGKVLSWWQQSSASRNRQKRNSRLPSIWQLLVASISKEKRKPGERLNLNVYEYVESTVLTFLPQLISILKLHMH